jgi:uncharacterized protein
MSTAVASPDVFAFSSAGGEHMLLVDGSRVYDLDQQGASELREAVDRGAVATQDFLSRHGLLGDARIDDEAPEPPPIRSLSLAVAQKCNLGCTYCYAQGGEFGGPAKSMDWTVARDAVQRLLESAGEGDRVHLAFMGGEPLASRALVRRATEFAREEARGRGVSIGFSITTNGTLLTPADAEFFETHGFAVTVSMDGVREVHDRLRPFRDGRGSYDRIIERVGPLLAMQRRMQVSARVTVTPQNLCLADTLDAFVALGFHSVGFAPMLKSPSGAAEMQSGDLGVLLEQMIECGRRFESRTLAGDRYPFSNMSEALRQIHRGTHRPYPCGAGAGYLGVSADGGLFACHRFVEDPRARLGDVKTGSDGAARVRWLQERHVHRQTPCRTCWARYLCGGGCHHEVIHRGRPACDYIRGWLAYCLEAYVNLMERKPDWFRAS